jgi:type IV secretion system protein VirB5
MKIFTKSSARYAHTPEPVTPYQRAAQEWDDRIGAATMRARNWRFCALGVLALAILLAAGLVWRSGQSLVTPYVVEVNATGQVRDIGEATTPYKPNDAQIAFHLARFVNNVRSLALDPIVVRQNWLDAYNYTTDRGAAILNEYARTHDPFSRVGQASVAVEVTSVVRASEHSFQIRWNERTYLNGALSGVERWTAIVTLLIQAPRTEERLRKNPLGLYVDGLNWNRELSAADQRKSPADSN